MDEQLQEIFPLLKKVFFILISNPKIMSGSDVSEEEIKFIINNKQLSLEVLQHTAGDDFFRIYLNELDLSEQEAREVQEFLYKSAPYFYDDLVKEFPFLVK